jgi:hypothetical protein
VNPPHVDQPVAAPPEPFLTELTLVPFYFEVDITDVDV